MTFISDLFKEKVNWNERELSALLSVLTYQAAIDGNIDDSEADLIKHAMANLPGKKPSDWEAFMKMTSTKGAKEQFEILQNMHKDKRALVVASLVLVSAADGHIDEDEEEAFLKIAAILNI